MTKPNEKKPSEAHRPEVGKFAKVYRGGEGLEVTVLRVGPESDKKVLLYFWGIDHEYNGRILLHEVVNESRDGRADYMIERDGKACYTFQMRDVGWGGPIYDVYLPGVKNGLRVQYDEAKSREVKPEHLLTRYLEQEAQDPSPQAKSGKKKKAA
jgi:hypothetical protein